MNVNSIKFGPDTENAFYLRALAPAVRAAECENKLLQGNRKAAPAAPARVSAGVTEASRTSENRFYMAPLEAMASVESAPAGQPARATARGPRIVALHPPAPRGFKGLVQCAAHDVRAAAARVGHVMGTTKHAVQGAVKGANAGIAGAMNRLGSGISYASHAAYRGLTATAQGAVFAAGAIACSTLFTVGALAIGALTAAGIVIEGGSAAIGHVGRGGKSVAQTLAGGALTGVQVGFHTAGRGLDAVASRAARMNAYVQGERSVNVDATVGHEPAHDADYADYMRQRDGLD